MSNPNPIESSGNNLSRQPSKKGGGGKFDPESNSAIQQEAFNYDKQVYKALLEETDFRELDKKNMNPKHIVILQEMPSLLKKQEFLGFFSQVISNCNPISSPREIVEGLTKAFKLSYEFQFKLILSFYFSKKEKFLKESCELIKIKAEEIFNSKSDASLSSETINNLVQIISVNDLLKKNQFLKGDFLKFLMMINSNNQDVNDKIFDSLSIQYDVRTF